MVSQAVRAIVLLSAGLGVVGAASPAAIAQTVGGFSAARGGLYAFESGANVSVGRSAILANYPGTALTSSDTLTPAFLSSLDVLIIATATSGGSAITPLSPAEQTALLDFILSGGRAVLITDNSTFNGGAPAANTSFVSPFGIAAAGTLSGTQLATMVPGSNPFNDGPYGTVNTLTTGFPGWYSNVGTTTVIARHNANNEPAFLAADQDLYGVGSGRMVFVSDTGLLDNALNQTLLLNTFDWVLVPSPSALSMLALGGLMAARRRR